MAGLCPYVRLGCNEANVWVKSDNILTCGILGKISLRKPLKRRRFFGTKEMFILIKTLLLVLLLCTKNTVTNYKESHPVVCKSPLVVQSGYNSS